MSSDVHVLIHDNLKEMSIFSRDGSYLFNRYFSIQELIDHKPYELSYHYDSDIELDSFIIELYYDITDKELHDFYHIRNTIFKIKEIIYFRKFSLLL